MMLQRSRSGIAALIAVAAVVFGAGPGAAAPSHKSRTAIDRAAGAGLEYAMLPKPRPLPPRILPAPLDLRVTAAPIDPEAYQRRQVHCLARAIYFEARSEPVDGQFAVARVVLNRTESGRYPDTICRVVYQNAHLENRCQFSFVCDGLPDEPTDSIAWAMALGMAAALVRTEDPLLSAQVLRSTHYHADYVRPYWAPQLAMTGTVGRHIFYREER